MPSMVAANITLKKTILLFPDKSSVDVTELTGHAQPGFGMGNSIETPWTIILLDASWRQVCVLASGEGVVGRRGWGGSGEVVLRDRSYG